MLDQYDRQGYLPIWALGGGENHCMIGHHAVPVVVGAPHVQTARASRLTRGYGVAAGKYGILRSL